MRAGTANEGEKTNADERPTMTNQKTKGTTPSVRTRSQSRNKAQNQTNEEEISIVKIVASAASSIARNIIEEKDRRNMTIKIKQELIDDTTNTPRSTNTNNSHKTNDTIRNDETTPSKRNSDGHIKRTRYNTGPKQTRLTFPTTQNKNKQTETFERITNANKQTGSTHEHTKTNEQNQLKTPAFATTGSSPNKTKHNNNNERTITDDDITIITTTANSKNTDTNKHQTKTIIREVECKR